MSPRVFVLLCLLPTVLLPTGLLEAQQPKKVPRIGYLSASSAAEVSPRAEAFRQGLRDLGYVEGKNLVIEFRYAEGRFDNLADLAAELVRRQRLPHRPRWEGHP
jgi:putative ABC transport system substrate-binding protein